jgi:hypothetical protein
MLRCASCGRALEPSSAWKGRGERYYCGEFCSDLEQIEAPPLDPAMEPEAPALTGASSRTPAG